MAEVELRVGAKLDLMNKEEFGHELTKGLKGHHDNYFREIASGIKLVRFPGGITGVPEADGTIVLAGDQPNGYSVGPRPGYTWAVERISVAGDDETDVISVYIGKVDPGNFIANIPLNIGFFSPGRRGLILPDGEQLAFGGANLTSPTITVTGSATQFPSEMIWKLY